MITPFKCQSCDAFGCEECNFTGWLLKDSENGAMYYTERVDGKLSIGPKKPPNSNWSKLFKRLFEEPHDLLWAIKNVRKASQR